MQEEMLRFSYERLIPSALSTDMVKGFGLDVNEGELRRYFASRRPIKAIMHYYGEDDILKKKACLSGNEIRLADMSLSCDVFREFVSCRIHSFFLYIISCGQEEDENIPFGQMNYHVVQNACLELVRTILRNNFQKITLEEYSQRNFFFSQEFGPGYFGMSLSEGQKIHRVLEGERIGVTYSHGWMKPLRSTAGLSFSYSGLEKPIVMNPCDYCSSNKSHCKFCGGHV